MNGQSSTSPRSRIAFLLILAVLITSLFLWVIKGFLMPLFFGAVFAGLLHPFYARVLKRVGGRKSLASAVTVVMSLVVVIIPLLIFIGIVAGEAVKMSESAVSWLADLKNAPGGVETQLEEIPQLKELLPYQDEVIQKASQWAQKAGAWIAQGLAAAAGGTAAFLLSVFVMLFAMFYFLMEGRALLDGILRFTPLTKDDQSRLLGIYVSVSRATLKGKLVIGIVQGGLAGLSFWLAGIEGVLFWSVVMAVLSIIPAVGTALVWVPAVIFLFLNGQTGAAIGVGLWCALVVGTIDNILNPILIGQDTKMPDLLVLLTTLGGLAAFGAAGILIGPIVGSLFMTIWELWGTAVDEREGAAGESLPSQ